MLLPTVADAASSPQRRPDHRTAAPQVGPAASVAPRVDLGPRGRLGGRGRAAPRPAPAGGVVGGWGGGSTLPLVCGLHHLLHVTVTCKLGKNCGVAQKTVVKVSLGLHRKGIHCYIQSFSLSNHKLVCVYLPSCV